MGAAPGGGLASAFKEAQLGRTPGWASVGKVGGSFLEMDVDLAGTDENEGHFYHEVGHVLGLLHEHQRYDRDTYVYVDRNGPSYNRLNYDRIPQWRNEKHCFLWVFCYVTAVRNSTHYDTPYDFHSVMHYPSTSVTRITLRNGNTWVVWRANKTEWGRQNHYTYFTPWDIYTIKRRYNVRPRRTIVRRRRIHDHKDDSPDAPGRPVSSCGSHSVGGMSGHGGMYGSAVGGGP